MRKLLICFDVDGTLIDDTVFIWQTLHDEIQTDPEEREYWTRAYWNKEISYHEWASKDVEMWMRKGVSKKDLLNAISILKPMEGVQETLKELKQSDHAMGIISGSLDIALEQAIPEYREYFEHVLLNRLLFDDKEMLTGVIPTPFDIEHKATGLQQIAEKLGFPIEDTVFVGDNFNDIEVAKLAGLSIAFNCKSAELAAIADVVIPGQDLREILPAIRTFSNT